MLMMNDQNTGPFSGISRRGFLKAGGLGALGALANWNTLAEAGSAGDRSVILLMLVGGPSQLDTWDPKPDAPAEVRGPFGSIATAVPGVRISEHLPRMARRLDRLTLIRSLSHDSAPIHETGQQLLQTGRLCRLGEVHPHFGSVAARLLGSRNDAPPFMVFPGPIANTGVAISHGQSAGGLGPDFEPCTSAHRDSDSFIVRTMGGRVRPGRDPREPFGQNPFGLGCLFASAMVEAGVRVVTWNMFDTVFDRTTWDCHGAAPFSTLQDYSETLLPTFDRALSALLDDLDARGLLETTLVVATGEFGRTPYINSAGGRDHWPGVWSAVLAGGDTHGGQVIGASDAHAGSPADRPVSPAELVATIYRHLRIDPARLLPMADGSLSRICDAGPIAGLLA